jgi:uncharacterized protein
MPDEVAARLSASPEERAAIIRQGAEEGIAEAQAVWGQMCLDAGDRKAAFGWFNKAAAQGHVLGLFMVGRCYDLGWGVGVDKVRAAQCFRRAAERGLDWGMYNYATALTLGAGVTEDKPAALAWFEKAAALGNAKAKNFVASFCEDGWVIPRNMARAAMLYADAAEGGDFRGQFNHARMLALGGNVAAALPWLTRCGESASESFVAKATAWLRREPMFGEAGVRALVAGITR